MEQPALLYFILIPTGNLCDLVYTYLMFSHSLSFSNANYQALQLVGVVQAAGSDGERGRERGMWEQHTVGAH